MIVSLGYRQWIRAVLFCFSFSLQNALGGNCGKFSLMSWCKVQDVLNTRSLQSPEAGNHEMYRLMKGENENLWTKLSNTEGETNNQPKAKQKNLRLNQTSQSEKLRLDMELTMLQCQYDEKQRQQQHEQKMCFLWLQSSPVHVGLFEKQWGRAGSSRCVLTTHRFQM